MTSPFGRQHNKLIPEDFKRFDLEFSRSIRKSLPWVQETVTFLEPDESDPDSYSLSITEGLEQVKQTGKPVILAEEGVILLPFAEDINFCAIGIAKGNDQELFDKVSEEWLLDQCHKLLSDFKVLKQQSVDPMTGFLNGHHLRNELEIFLNELEYSKERKVSDGSGDPEESTDETGEYNSLSSLSLVLLEIYPRARNAERAYQYIVKAGYSLESMLGHSYPLHYLGAGVFGLAWPGVDEAQAVNMGETFLRWLKQENFHSVHIGSNTITSTEVNADIIVNVLLENSWKALRAASHRGPYAQCTYTSIINKKFHPLHIPSRSIRAKFGVLYRNYEKFAVVLIKKDPEIGQKADDINFSKREYALLESKATVVPVNKKEVYIFLENADENKAVDWSKDINNKIKKLGCGTVSMGIACYPCLDFKKSEILLNSRKALLHTEFFGPDTLTPFDAVSLNVSGDIYYGEGDLPKAVKEYRKGITLDPLNCNLLNSLGEVYAKMNRHRMAVPFFEEVIDICPDNFMAHFNLGIAFLKIDKEGQAIIYFESAQEIFAKQETGVKNLESRTESTINNNNYGTLIELKLQLGKLYCLAGRYQDAVSLLDGYELWFEEYDSDKAVDRENAVLAFALRYLGEAYKELGLYKKSITVLQRALRHNPRDAASLSLLGVLYSQEGEKSEIPLSLCQQAVDLDDTQWEFWYRLGWVQYQSGDLPGSEESLKSSLQYNRKSVDSMSLLGTIFEKKKEYRQALRMYERTLNTEPQHPEALKARNRLQRRLLKIKRSK